MIELSGSARVTLVSALVSATFSALSRSMVGIGHQHEYSLYATSRSIALLLTTVFVMSRRSREGAIAMAIAMTIVQVLDATCSGPRKIDFVSLGNDMSASRY